jgi:kinesin family protein C2/C3
MGTGRAVARAFGDAVDANVLEGGLRAAHAHAAKKTAAANKTKTPSARVSSDAPSTNKAAALAAMEASHRIALKGLQRKLAAAETALAEKEESARMEHRFFEEERLHAAEDLRAAVALERRLASEDAARTARAAGREREDARLKREAELEEELASERRRNAELVGIVSRQSRDLAKGGDDAAALAESFERAAEAREAAARREAQVKIAEARAAREADIAAAVERAREEAAATAEANRASEEAFAKRFEDADAKLRAETAKRLDLERRLDAALEEAAAERRSAASSTKASASSGDAARLRRELAATRATIRELRDAHAATRLEALAAKDAATRGVALAAAKVAELGAAARRASERRDEAIRERRALSNQLMELRGNIRVFLRVRPLSRRERDDGETAALVPHGGLEARLSRPSLSGSRSFAMDAVFGPDASQSDVFEEVAPLIRSAMDGYDACIFAYGQTGSGKTHTMEGTEEDRGVTFRAMSALFREAERAREADGVSYAFWVTMLEVYQDKVRDLLALDPSDPKPHEVRRGPDGAARVENLERVAVTSSMDVMRVMRRGAATRKTGRTDANERSSRSHLVFTVEVEGRDDRKGETTKSRLNLVDLAGSERLSKTNATGERLAEAQHINKSLSALGNCMAALAAKQKARKRAGGGDGRGGGSGGGGHVPFRDCKLTHILSPCLSGEGKTLMFVHAGPAGRDASESQCTLEFGSRVRAVELGQARRHAEATGSTGAADAEKLREALGERDEMIEALRRELRALKG